ncbi:MAG: hypothetical protein AAFQ83_13120 [Bacteroidota bacterium]
MASSIGTYTRGALSLCILFLSAVHFLYYPKWNETGTEATLSWDVSGYYWYLPAAFIYGDLKRADFSEEIIQKYNPTSSFEQAFEYENGSRVMKYSMGQAVTMMPAFFVGHLWALVSDYPADGFSFPYQITIGLWSLLLACLGLWMLARILALYFSDKAVAWVLLIIAIGTNFLEYSAIQGSMTHGHLFFLYTLLIWQTIRFYQQPRLLSAIGIGALIGLAALIRPTELMTLLIPVLWGLDSWQAVKDRIQFVRVHFTKYLLAGIVTGLVGGLQLIYWKYVSGDWIVYSYQDQGFNWIKPFISDGLFSYRAGWLMYTPIMIFAIIGFPFLVRQHKNLLWVSLIYTLIFCYVAFAWEIWWYGGSLGQRTMVQAYPVLAFPLAALVEWGLRKKIAGYLLLAIGIFFAYVSLWFVHQAHKGGLLRAGDMTRGYYRAIFLRYEIDPDEIFYLDNNDRYYGERKNVQTLGIFDFEGDTTLLDCGMKAISGNQSLCSREDLTFTPMYEATITPGQGSWIRAHAQFYTQEGLNGPLWQAPQFVVRLFKGDQIVKNRQIRPHRRLVPHQTMTIFSDLRIPAGKDYDRVGVFFWHQGGTGPFLVDDLKIEVFDPG